MENKLIAEGTTTDLNSYTFSIKDEPIVVITEDGFKYKGELIEDKGEIYQIFKNYLTSYQTEISDEEYYKDIFYQKQVMNPYLTGEQSYTAYEQGFMDCAKWYKEKLQSLKAKKINYE